MLDVATFTWDEYHQLLSVNNISAHQANQFEHSQPFERNRVSLFIAYSILLLVGLAGNGWVACVIICVLRTPRRVQSSTSIQIFILALCCCDLIVLGFLIFLLLDLAYGRWIVPSNFVCQLYLCSEALNKFFGPFLLVSMSGYCYYTVCRPKKTGGSLNNRNCGNTSSNRPWSILMMVFAFDRINKEVKQTLTLILICIIIVIILMIPVYIYGGITYLIVHNSTVVRTVLPKCSVQPPEHVLTIFTTYSFILGYTLPALLFTYFYSAILWRVRRRRHFNGTGDSPIYFWRVAKTCMVLVLFYVFCWTPYWAMSIYHFMKPLTDSSNSHRQGGIVLSYFIHMLPYINVTGYPILYTLINRSIKAAYVQAKEERRRRHRDRKLQKLQEAERKVTPTGESSNFGNETTSMVGNGQGISIAKASCDQRRMVRRKSENGECVEDETVL